jgi:ABC-2 type transport system ATP-binding protein
VFGYLGPSGASKTTTIGLLLDFIPPTSGRVEVLGATGRRVAVPARPREGSLGDGLVGGLTSSGGGRVTSR